QILAQLARLGFSSILDYVTQTESGDIVVDLEDVERDAAAGIVELRLVEKGEGAERRRDLRIRLADKRGPLVDLGRHFGLFVERKDDVHGRDLHHLTDDQLRQRARELQQKLGLAGPAQPEQGVRGDVVPQGEDEA